MSVSQRKAGAILSYIKLAASAVLSLVYVPLLLAFLGDSQYGVYELIGSIIAYLSLADMGFMAALNRFFVRTRIQGGDQASQNLLAMAAIVYGVLTVLAVGLALGFDAILDCLLKASFTASELELAHRLMKLVALNCLIVLPGNWFAALVNANERFIYANAVGIIKIVLQTVVIVFVLTHNAGAVGVIAVQVMFNALCAVANAWYVLRVLRIKARLVHWDFGLLRSMFSFSAFSMLESVFNQLYWKTGQVVLGAVCGSTAVAVYGVACRLVTQGFMSVASGLTGVFLPKLTAIAATTDSMDEINQVFRRTGRLQGIVVWGVMAGFIAVGQEFIELWAGSDFRDAYVAVLFFLPPLAISLVQNLGLVVLQAKNKMAFRCVVYFVLAVVDVLACIPVARHFGVTGCAAVTGALLFLGTGPIINLYYHRVIGLDIPAFFRQVLPLAIPAALSAVTARVFRVVCGMDLSWGALCASLVVFGVVDALLLWFVWANDSERNLVRAFIKRLAGQKNL